MFFFTDKLFEVLGIKKISLSYSFMCIFGRRVWSSQPAIARRAHNPLEGRRFHITHCLAPATNHLLPLLINLKHNLYRPRHNW